MNKEDRKLREKRILEIVVQSYILTANPVSSGYVSRKLGLSSATIRNVMADLEEIGLINHPHTSAGRIPTDKGYRFYVDSLMHLKKATDKQIRQIESEYHSKVRSLEDMLEKTTHILSEFTSCAGMAFLPKIDEKLFRHINLVPLSKKRVLVLLVAESGFVKDYIIELEYPLDVPLLNKISNFLNSKLYNMNLEEIKSYLVGKLQIERNSSYKLIEVAYKIVRLVLMRGLRDKFYFDGTSQILAYPEFRNQRKLESILKVFEEREIILNILTEDLYEDGLRVRIGSENRNFGVDALSVITAGFKMKDQAIGRLGIIGPTRIDYERVIPIVDLFSTIVTKALSYWD